MNCKEDIPLSVIMAVYNGEKYLAIAIDSILGQNFRDFEFLIVNDGSTDATQRICESYEAQDSRIVLIRNEKNVGLTRSLNQALHISRGKCIARMDADDISHRRRFEVQIQYLENNPEVGLLGTFYQELDDDGNIHEEVIRFPTQPMIIKWHLAYENPVPHPPIMVRRNILQKVGGYDEEWLTSQDYDLFTRLSQVTKLKNLPDILFYWRVHDKSISSQKNTEQRQNALQISQRFLSNLLGERISMSQVKRLWYRQPECPHDSVLRARTMLRVAQRILDEPVWSSHEKDVFRRYATRKIFYYLRPHFFVRDTWKMTKTLFVFSPVSFLKLFSSKVRRASSFRNSLR
jgi:glycosyltransferase involved in cell wall biosynthesis